MKQIKLLGVLAIALTLGLASCGQSGSNGKSDDQPAEHVHTFDESVWEHDSNNHWHPATCEHKTQKGSKAAHEFGEPYDIVPATCTEPGSQKVKCTVCQYEKTETLKATGHSDAPAEGSSEWTPIDEPTCTEDGKHSYVCSKCNQPVEVVIPKLGHAYEQEDGADKVVWSQVADCTNDGAGTKTCTRCGAVENVTKAALGHDFVKDAETGEDVITWTKRATCTEAGVGSKHCQRCNLDIPETEAALGHDIHLVDDQGEPEEGYAKVRLYDCSRCDVTYLGFKATEVTAASHDRLVFETVTTGDKEEQGARFFGHPIGNDCELDPQTGDPSEGVAAVYSKEQTGDYFEYKFKLTQEQVDALSGDEDACLCYVDALPANWMQQNNMDFFAKGTETDWTKAYYIDEDPAHYEAQKDSEGNPVLDDQGNPVMVAKEIAGWRYVLYVDGHYQDFDANVATNKMANNNRGEFVMPYLFKLHTGENSISLRMAAGYRCTFFNFTFRPYVKPTQIVAGPASIELTEGETAQITSEMEGLSYKSGSNSVATVSNTGLVTAVKAGETKITVSKDGNYRPMEIPVKVNAPAGVIDLALADGEIAPEGGFSAYSSGSSGFWLRNPKKDATLTYTFNSELAGKFDLKFGLRGSNINVAEAISVKVNGDDVVVSGNVNGGYNAVEMVIGQADLIKGSNTMVITAVADSSLYIKSLQLVPHQYVAFQSWTADEIFPTLTGTGWANPKDFGEAGKAFKFNKVGGFTVSYESASAQKVLLQMKIAVKQSNNAKTGFWAQVDEAEVKTKITVNNKVITPGAEPDFTGSTASTVNDSGIISVPEWYNIIEIDLVEGPNTITIEYVAGGYSYYVGGVALAK